MLRDSSCYVQVPGYFMTRLRYLCFFARPPLGGRTRRETPCTLPVANFAVIRMDVRVEQRVNIKFGVKLAKTATETLQLLNGAYVDEALSQARVFGWHRRFVLSRVSAEDDKRLGRPSGSRNEDNVVRISDMIKEDRTVTVRVLADALHINKSTCHQILQDLGKRKHNARLVPHALTQDQKEVRASNCADLLHEAQNDATFVNSIIVEDESWCFQYDPQTKRQSAEWRSMCTPPSKKVRRQSSTTKTIILIFFSTPESLFITTLSHKSKRSTEKFTSPYSGACARQFNVVVLTCGHQDGGICCKKMRGHRQL